MDYLLWQQIFTSVNIGIDYMQCTKDLRDISCKMMSNRSLVPVLMETKREERQIASTSNIAACSAVSKGA